MACQANAVEMSLSHCGIFACLSDAWLCIVVQKGQRAPLRLFFYNNKLQYSNLTTNQVVWPDVPRKNNHHYAHNLFHVLKFLTVVLVRTSTCSGRKRVYRLKVPQLSCNVNCCTSTMEYPASNNRLVASCRRS